MPRRRLLSLEGLFAQLAPDYFTRTGLETLLLTQGLTVPPNSQTNKQQMLLDALKEAKTWPTDEYEQLISAITGELARSMERQTSLTDRESAFLEMVHDPATFDRAPGGNGPGSETLAAEQAVVSPDGEGVVEGGSTQLSASYTASGRKVFLVHGRSLGAEAVARFVDKLGYEPVLLKERPSQGRSIIEKFLDEASDVAFAIVILTGDDEGALRGDPPRPRARQNVVFEFGFFVSALGRSRTAVLYEQGVELPTDLLGVGWVAFDAGGDGWKMALAREMKAAGMQIDMNNV